MDSPPICDTPLTIFQSGTIASLRGFMVFPNDCEKAEIVAGHEIAERLAHAGPEAHMRVSPALHCYLHSQTTKFPPLFVEATREAYRGSQAGMMASFLWRAPESTWEGAANAAMRVATDKKHLASRSPLFQAKRDFATVLHFWTTLANDYGNVWPPVGLDYAFFAMRAEGLLRLMREREHSGKLAGQTFTSPKIIVPLAAGDTAAVYSIAWSPLPPRIEAPPRNLGGRPRKPQA